MAAFFKDTRLCSSAETRVSTVQIEHIIITPCPWYCTFSSRACYWHCFMVVLPSKRKYPFIEISFFSLDLMSPGHTVYLLKYYCTGINNDGNDDDYHYGGGHSGDGYCLRGILWHFMTHDYSLFCSLMRRSTLMSTKDVRPWLTVSEVQNHVYKHFKSSLMNHMDLFWVWFTVSVFLLNRGPV